MKKTYYKKSLLNLLIAFCGILFMFSPSTLKAQLSNGSFESTVITNNTASATAVITNWTRSASPVNLIRGISAYGNPPAMNGDQLLAFQGQAGLTQTITVSTSGNYIISLFAAQRQCCAPAGGPFTNTLQFRVDGTLVGTVAPTLANFSYFSFNLGILSVGTHTIEILSTAATDQTVFVDDVAISFVADTDVDGYVNSVDLDDDNDGILDTTEGVTNNFFWNNAPVISGNQATGTINGVNYIYKDYGTATLPGTNGYVAYATFPSSYGIPNHNPTIKNETAGTKVISFSAPVTNPTFVFASIGRAGVPVPITFSAPIDILWSTAVVKNNATRLTGTEGYAIVQIPGVFTSVSFTYAVAENYCNFGFGGNFFTYVDTEGDGTPNVTDNDSDNDGVPDALEAKHSVTPSQINTQGRLVYTVVDANGVPDIAPGGFTPVNTDGADVTDFIDIDSDNDGIVDVIESQPTTGYRATTGSDTDADGIDNAFDVNFNVANTLITTLEDTDGDGTPDIWDANSDGDASTDMVEAAQGTYAATDTDGDGLANIFDVVVKTSSPTTNSTNGGQTARNPFPDTNNPGIQANWRTKLCTTSPSATAATSFASVGISTHATNLTNWPGNIANGSIVLQSSSKGFVVTRISTAARDDASFVPVEGMLIYNTTVNRFQLRKASSWVNLRRGCNN